MTLFVNNADCPKMVDHAIIVLHRVITARGLTTGGETKEFNDEQIVMKAKMNVKVAAKEPFVKAFSFSILMKNYLEHSCEKNKFLMLYDIVDGSEIPFELKRLQHEVLPSLDSELVQVKYRLECQVVHEGMLWNSKQVASLFWPLYVAVDPKGPIEFSPN